MSARDILTKQNLSDRKNSFRYRYYLPNAIKKPNKQYPHTPLEGSADTDCLCYICSTSVLPFNPILLPVVDPHFFKQW